MKTPAQWKAWFESEEFARQTDYQGPLGAAYSPSGTHLRLWAPTAQSVRVDLYRKGDGGACIGSLPLSPWGQGVWGVYLPGDQHGKYYNFNVTTEWGSVTTADPYARAAGVNGARSMIVDLARTDPPGWEQDKRPVIPASKRSVWEVSVRDFSQDPASGVRNAWRGKFLAFTQQGTTLNGDGVHPTCLNYLKRLGVRYVQLLPIFDFGSVDESRPLTRQYNWGYDPANFNVPEGSYSTDPARGEVRVRECKQMIQALHAAGIGVVMDVVYNHMYRSDNVLNRAVPLYYFRQNEDGSLSNGSGCGNEFASERPMARQYFLDSVLYWAQEYHIDGFRFDLMGLYDVETMNLLRAELDKLPGGRDILMYGEPWQGGSSALHRYEANKNNLAMLNDRIGIFCDDTRDAIKGGCFNAREPGYVEGRPGSFWDIGGAVAAWCRSDKFPPHTPGQIVSYVSAPTTILPCGTSCFWCATSARSSARWTVPPWPRTGWRQASTSPAWACPSGRQAKSSPAPKRGRATATAPPRRSTDWTGSGPSSFMGWWTITGASSGCGMPSRGWVRWTGPAPTPLHFLIWNSRWWAGVCLPCPAMGRGGARSASTTTPPNRNSPSGCPTGAGSC